MKAFLYRVCAIFFSHFVLYPDYRISFFIPLAFRFADYISLLFIGIYFLWEESLGLSSLFLLVCFLSYVFCCAVSICAVVFVLLSEMYPTKVRGLAMSIAGFSLWIGTYLIGQLTPWMLQNLTPAGTFFLFAAMCVPYMLIVWKLVPETTGKSLEEIERYWTRMK